STRDSTRKKSLANQADDHKPDCKDCRWAFPFLGLIKPSRGLLIATCHSTIDAVRTAHRILRNHELYRDFKKSDLSV
ncbi:MAG: hypothetical protein P8179_08770, partial [Candidatus Thiodiazotropha sp.]